MYGTKRFGGRKLWWIAANKHLGGQNIGGLAALYSKLARIKIVDEYNYDSEPPNPPKFPTSKVLRYMV